MPAILIFEQRAVACSAYRKLCVRNLRLLQAPLTHCESMG
jgi:hypothetical protein